MVAEIRHTTRVSFRISGRVYSKGMNQRIQKDLDSGSSSALRTCVRGINPLKWSLGFTLNGIENLSVNDPRNTKTTFTVEVSQEQLIVSDSSFGKMRDFNTTNL